MAGPKLFRSRGIMVLFSFGEFGPMNSMLVCWFGSQFGAGSRLAYVPTAVDEQFREIAAEPRPFVPAPVPLVPYPVKKRFPGLSQLSNNWPPALRPTPN